MADNVNEESDYTPGKDELDWGYEEGMLDLISMSHSGSRFGLTCLILSQSGQSFILLMCYFWTVQMVSESSSPLTMIILNLTERGEASVTLNVWESIKHCASDELLFSHLVFFYCCFY